MRIRFAVPFLLGVAACLSALGQSDTNAHSGRFSRGAGTNVTYHSFVLALDFQKGVELDDIDGNATNLFPANMWTTTLYHYDALEPSSSTNTNLRIPYENPIVAFGSRVGGSPLYSGQDYRFGVYGGYSEFTNTSVIYVYARDPDDGSTIGWTNIYIPQEFEAALWNEFATNGYTITVSAFGLTTTVGRLTAARWGTGYRHSYLVTHRASDEATNYIFQVNCLGYTDGSWMSTVENGGGTWSRMYTAEFEPRPPWRAGLVDQPHFEGEPLPSAYHGKSMEELLATAASIPAVSFADPATYLQLDHSPELRRHPILDRFVEDMDGDPIALANYVAQEVETTDAMDYDAEQNDSSALYLSGINRSALGVFQEGQGSPLEQCALLVYLLREAGVPATFVFPTNNGMHLLDRQVSRMLGVQLREALYYDGTTNGLPQLIPVNYPWVAAYLTNESRWVHVFPWIKDIELVEGLNLYDHLPDDYNSGYKLLLKYLEEDSAIMSLSAESDLPEVLFPRFIEKSLRDNYPGVSLEDIGMRRVQRRNYHARWEDFPRPFSLSGTPAVKESYQNDLDWFNTVQVRVSSANNTNLYVDSGELRIADIHNRRLLLRFEQIGTANSHRMILSLAPYHTGITNKGVFGGNPAYALSATNTLSSSDNALGYRIIYRRLKSLGPSYTAPNIFTNYYEYSYDQPGQKKLGVEYDTEEKPFRKGDMVALCLDTGRVTEKMLRVHAEELWQFERTAPDTPANQRDPEIYLGVPTYMMGMSYWESMGRFRKWNENIHKIKTVGNFAFGFALLKPKRDGNGNLIDNGAVIPVEPHVHMPGRAIVSIYNGTARADSAQDYEATHWDYRLVHAAQGSAAEHGVIESFFNTNAVSTIRLLHLTGAANVLWLNHHNYLSYQSQIASADAEIWGAVSNWFNSGLWSTNNSQAFLTPSNVTSGSYSGMGALLIKPYGTGGLISGLLNGGAGQAFPDDAFSADNADEWRLVPTPEGSQTPYTFAQDGVNTDNFASFQSSQYQLGSTYDALSSQWYDPQLAAQSLLLNDLFGETPGDLQAAFVNGVNFGVLDTHTSWIGDGIALVADPVNAINGEHYLDTVDLRLNGPMPLEVRRNYSSLNLAANQFGYGWKMSMAPGLTLVTNGLIFAAEPNGSVIAYTPSPTNSSLWLPSPEHNPHLNNTSASGVNSLVNPLNAYIVQETVSGTNVYQLYQSDGGVRRFEVRSFQIDAQFTRERPYLVQWQDNRSNYFTFSYEDDINRPGYGQVRRVQSSNGDFLGFYHDVFGRIVEAYTGDGRRLHYEYDKEGDLTKVTLPDVSEIEYEYRHDSYTTNSVTRFYSTHLISREIKPDGRVLVNHYDGHRRVVAQEATVGLDLNTYTNAVFIYSNNFNSASPDEPINGFTLVLDAYGHTNRYDYTNSLLTRITDPLGQTIEQDWYWTTDSNGGYARSLKSRKNKRGLLTEYRYDPQGNATNVTLRGNLTGADQTNETFVTVSTYTNALPLTTSNSVGQVTKFIYADINYPLLPTSVETWSSNTLVSVTRHTYYETNSGTWFSRGLPRETIRAYGSSDAATNQWLHNGRGRLIRDIKLTGTADPAVTNDFFYNHRGELVERVDAAGRTNRFDYDAMGRLKWRETIDGNGVQLAGEYSYYNQNGELSWTDGPRYDPEDYVWRDHDGAGRLMTEIRWRSQAREDGTGVEAPAGYDLYSVTWSEHDLFGNLTRTVDPRGAIVTNTWDAIGQLLRRDFLDLDGTTLLSTEGFSYEPGGKVAFHTNALGGVTETLYTSTGQPKYRKTPDGSTNAWRYRTDGRIEKEIQRNGAFWLTSYDDASRRTTRVYHSAGGTPLATNVTELDQRGNVIRTVDAAGFAFTNYFDDLDRLKGTAGPVIETVKNIGMNPANPVYVTNIVQQTTTNYFDAAGVVTTNANALGEKTITWTDALGRTTRVEIRNAVNALIRETTTAHHANHHGLTVTNGSGASAIISDTFTDNEGRTVLSVAHPYSNVREYTRSEYDMAGNLVFEGRYAATNSSVAFFSGASSDYDGLNRLVTRIDRDDALTTFYYDAAGNLTNRSMPGNLQWRAAYNNAGLMLADWNSGTGGSVTRSNSYSYYSAGHQWAGLVQARTDGRGVTRTHFYDDWLRNSDTARTNSTTGSFIVTTLSYDERGFATNIFENRDSVATTIERRYDAYGQLVTDRVLQGSEQSSASQSWDAAGRRSSLFVSVPPTPITYTFGWRADGALTSIAAGGGALSYGYDTAGLLTNRTAGVRGTTISSRDGAGRPLTVTTKVNTLTKLTETLGWTGDGLISAQTLAREDFTDSQSFFYADLSRRLVEERINLNASQRWTNLFTYDGDGSAGLGVLTRIRPSTSSSNLAGGVDAFARINTATNTSSQRVAEGRANGWATITATLDGQPVPVSTIDDPFAAVWVRQWRSTMELFPGAHQLTVNALHPSGSFTTNASVWFTNNVANETTGDTFDGGGLLTVRVWKKPDGTTNRTQTLVWDPKGRLIQVTDLDGQTNGWDWFALYDGLDRRMHTWVYQVTNGVYADVNGIAQYHDPEVEFLELGTKIAWKTTWKIYGSDASGVFGGMQGLGGLDAVVTPNGGFQPVIADTRGNVLASVTNSTVVWHTSRPTGYGAVPGRRPLPLGHGGELADASSWRGRWSDISGLYWLGARYYDPVAGRFLSADPMPNERDPNLYTFAGGDPINHFDPDGRFGKQAIGRTLGLLDGNGYSLYEGTSFGTAYLNDQINSVIPGQIAEMHWYNGLPPSEQLAYNVPLPGVFNSVQLVNNLSSGDLSAAGANAWSFGTEALLTAMTLGLFSGPSQPMAAPSTRASFYVTPEGVAIPATGYRAIGGPLVAEAQMGTMPSRNPTYLTFNDITRMTPAETQSLLQLPRTPSHVARFDTLQLVDDLAIPTRNWNAGTIPEPITMSFPRWGAGGGSQAITWRPIHNVTVSPLPTTTLTPSLTPVFSIPSVQ